MIPEDTSRVSFFCIQYLVVVCSVTYDMTVRHVYRFSVTDILCVIFCSLTYDMMTLLYYSTPYQVVCIFCFCLVFRVQLVVHRLSFVRKNSPMSGTSCMQHISGRMLYRIGVRTLP